MEGWCCIDQEIQLATRGEGRIDSAATIGCPSCRVGRSKGEGAARPAEHDHLDCSAWDDVANGGAQGSAPSGDEKGCGSPPPLDGGQEAPAKVLQLPRSKDASQGICFIDHPTGPGPRCAGQIGLRLRDGHEARPTGVPRHLPHRGRTRAVVYPLCTRDVADPLRAALR